MTEHEVQELDDQLRDCGLTYDARSELFQTVTRADAEPEPVE